QRSAATGPESSKHSSSPATAAPAWRRRRLRAAVARQTPVPSENAPRSRHLVRLAEEWLRNGPSHGVSFEARRGRRRRLREGCLPYLRCPRNDDGHFPPGFRHGLATSSLSSEPMLLTLISTFHRKLFRTREACDWNRNS